MKFLAKRNQINKKMEDFLQTIREFCDMIIPIVNDLESKNRLKKGTTATMKLIKESLFAVFTPEQLLEHYKTKILVHKEAINSKNEKFFLENNDIYPGAEAKDINLFKTLWTGKNMMTETEKESTWEYFQVLIEIVEDITTAK